MNVNGNNVLHFEIEYKVCFLFCFEVNDSNLVPEEIPKAKRRNSQTNIYGGSTFELKNKVNRNN